MYPSTFALCHILHIHFLLAVFSSDYQSIWNNLLNDWKSVSINFCTLPYIAYSFSLPSFSSYMCSLLICKWTWLSQKLYGTSIWEFFFFWWTNQFLPTPLFIVSIFAGSQFGKFKCQSLCVTNCLRIVTPNYGYHILGIILLRPGQYNSVLSFN